MMRTVAGALLTATALITHLLADARGLEWLRRASKLTASAGFLWAAWDAGAGRAGLPGATLLLALGLAALGDALLLSARERPFVAGLAAFLLAHLTLVPTFLLAADPSPSLFGVALLASGALALAAVALRWLEPHLSPELALPVRLYVAAITLMLASSGALLDARPEIPAAAFAFALSDLSVARDRFVRPGLANRLWGLPLYYAAQLVLATQTLGPLAGG